MVESIDEAGDVAVDEVVAWTADVPGAADHVAADGGRSSRRRCGCRYGGRRRVHESAAKSTVRPPRTTTRQVGTSPTRVPDLHAESLVPAAETSVSRARLLAPPAVLRGVAGAPSVVPGGGTRPPGCREGPRPRGGWGRRVVRGRGPRISSGEVSEPDVDGGDPAVPGWTWSRSSVRRAMAHRDSGWLIAARRCSDPGGRPGLRRAVCRRPSRGRGGGWPGRPRPGSWSWCRVGAGVRVSRRSAPRRPAAGPGGVGRPGPRRGRRRCSCNSSGCFLAATTITVVPGVTLATRSGPRQGSQVVPRHLPRQPHQPNHRSGILVVCELPSTRPGGSSSPSP